MNSPKISPKAPPEVLYVPFYLRRFNTGEKIILVLLIFFTSCAVSLMPIVLSLVNTPAINSTTIDPNETRLPTKVANEHNKQLIVY